MDGCARVGTEGTGRLRPQLAPPSQPADLPPCLLPQNKPLPAPYLCDLVELGQAEHRLVSSSRVESPVQTLVGFGWAEDLCGLWPFTC